VQGDEEAGQTHDGAAAMQMLQPSFVWVLRIRIVVLAIPIVVLIAVLDLWASVDAGPLRSTDLPYGLMTGTVALFGLFAVLLLPNRRYRAWGYAEGEDELAIRRGVWVRLRTIVPFGRVQHIDVAQGPIERRYDLATLILHTAGTRSASVALPGLLQRDAEAMRDRIRAKIRQDLV
jgi:uncharacterized protein